MSLPPNLPAGAGAATAPFNPANYSYVDAPVKYGDFAKLTADVHAIDADAVALATRLNAGTSGFAANSVPAAGQIGHLQTGAVTGVAAGTAVITNLLALPTLSAGTYMIDLQCRVQHATSTVSTNRYLEITESATPGFTYLQSFKNWVYNATGIIFIKTHLIVQVPEGQTSQRYATFIINGTSATVNANYSIARLG